MSSMICINFFGVVNCVPLSFSPQLPYGYS
jgi:hypothetical protein